MNGRIGLLGGLLIVQLLVIAALLFGSRDSAQAQGPLLAFSADIAQSLTIDEGPAAAPAADAEASAEAADTAPESVTVQRVADRWEVAGLPADADKVNALLARLADLRSAWPVATTLRAQSRFEVADDRYRKRVQVALGDGSAQSLLLGSSPGFKRVHARVPGNDAVYSIALAEFDLPTATVDWLDKALLAFAGDVTRVRRDGQWEASLEVPSAADDTTDGAAEPARSWLIGPLAAGALAAETAAADPQAMQTLLNRFRSLQVIGIAPAESDASLVDTFILESTAGERHRYELFEDSTADRYFLARDDIEGRFEIAGYLAEQFRTELTALVPADVDETSAEDGATEDAAGAS
ncbi:MAG: DUF4340 domain-containing protein [Pseudomonadota bacterium]